MVVSVRPTQKQVAQRAGVSQTIVSQVLNGQTEQVRISPETRQKVLSAIRELGYVPNAAAQRLVGARSSILGVFTYEAVFPASTRNFYAPFLAGIEQEAAEHGLDLLLYTSAQHSQHSLSQSVSTRLSLTDGTILLGNPDQQDRHDLAQLVRGGHPLVFIGRRDVPHTSLACVQADYTGATAELTQRFQQLGHRQLCYLGEPEISESAQDREDGFVLAGGQQVTRLLPQQLDAAHLRQLREQGFTGFLAENDRLMRQLLHAAGQLGWSVPQDFSVAVLGNAITEEPAGAHWTRFQIPREAMGRGAVSALQALIRRKKPDPLIFSCHIHMGHTLAQVPKEH